MAEKATKRKKPRSQKSHEAKKATKPKMPQSRKSHKAKNAASFFYWIFGGNCKVANSSVYTWCTVATIWIYFSQQSLVYVHRLLLLYASALTQVHKWSVW